MAVMSPGPDLIMMLRNSVMYSRKAALFSAMGLGLGIALHVTYCLLGLALIISQSVLLFTVIKYLGAAYLVYIGIKSLQSRKGDAIETFHAEKKDDISSLQALRLGFLTNALNPKATLFFLALFTQVISASTPLLMKMAYGIEMMLATIAWFSIVAIFMTQNPIRKAFLGIKHYIELCFGIVLIGLGIKVALASK